MATLSDMDYDGRQCDLVIPIAAEIAGQGYALRNCDYTARAVMERLCAEHDCEAIDLRVMRYVPYDEAMLDGELLRDAVASLGMVGEHMTFLVYRATARKRAPV